ncbi:hypothetical protein EDB19DRAFT_318410 [Suillus lakei]|nr:hypothetical protein EDB19DRAFT_318410 [Suillus lakei]
MASHSQPEGRTLRNVVIIGQLGVGKSSLINMLCPSANAATANDISGCTMVEQKYTCDLGERQCCTVHDTVGLEEGFWGFIWAPKTEKRLKSYLEKNRPHLMVYCIPGTRGSLNKFHGRNFNKFKSVVGKVPIVVVVTNLERSRNPGDWWSANLDILRTLGIPEFTEHACVTTLPKAYLGPKERGLYDSSREAVKALIRNNLPRY